MGGGGGGTSPDAGVTSDLQWANVLVFVLLSLWKVLHSRLRRDIQARYREHLCVCVCVCVCMSV